MVTIKTLKNSKSSIKNILDIVKKMGHGSISISNKIDLDYLVVQANNIVYYKYQNPNEINLTFQTKPYLVFLGFKRTIESILIKEDEILITINKFPDFRITIT